MDVLLSHGAETNVVDVNYCTPMHLAALRRNIEIGSMLLDRDARIDAKDKVQYDFFW